MLIDASLEFPTVVFTIGLGVVLVYWLFVMLGAFDIDLFGGAEGGGEGFGDAGGGDVGGADGADGGDGGDGAGDGGGHGVWYGLGLGAVPITISVSLILLVGWIGSLAAVHLAPSIAAATWSSALLLPVMLVVALLVTAVLVRPLAPFFKVKVGKSNRDYIGYTCTISTGSVDDGFGQATIEDGGTVLIIPVRCDRPGRFARGDRALVIDYDPDREVYVVEPSVDMLPAPSGDAGVHEA